MSCKQNARGLRQGLAARAAASLALPALLPGCSSGQGLPDHGVVLVLFSYSHLRFFISPSVLEIEPELCTKHTAPAPLLKF